MLFSRDLKYLKVNFWCLANCFGALISYVNQDLDNKLETFLSRFNIIKYNDNS